MKAFFFQTVAATEKRLIRFSYFRHSVKFFKFFVPNVNETPDWRFDWLCFCRVVQTAKINFLTSRAINVGQRRKRAFPQFIDTEFSDSPFNLRKRRFARRISEFAQNNGVWQRRFRYNPLIHPRRVPHHQKRDKQAHKRRLQRKTPAL